MRPSWDTCIIRLRLRTKVKTVLHQQAANSCRLGTLVATLQSSRTPLAVMQRRQFQDCANQGVRFIVEQLLICNHCAAVCQGWK